MLLRDTVVYVGNLHLIVQVRCDDWLTNPDSASATVLIHLEFFEPAELLTHRSSVLFPNNRNCVSICTPGISESLDSVFFTQIIVLLICIFCYTFKVS